MVQTPFPLTALSEEQQAQALQRYSIIRPALTCLRRSTRAALVEQLLAVHQQETPRPETQAKEPVETTGRPRLKRYINE